MKPTLMEIAVKLDQFAQDFDQYDYWDQVQDEAEHIAEIVADLENGRAALYRIFLTDAIEELEETELIEKAKNLLSILDAIR